MNLKSKENENFRIKNNQLKKIIYLKKLEYKFKFLMISNLEVKNFRSKQVKYVFKKLSV